MEKESKNIKMSFPRHVVGNLPLSVSLLKEEKQTYIIKQVEDPRQKHSGMTGTCYNGNDEIPDLVRDDSRRCNGGFTLIELLVVVLIIGILAAVALPQYQKAVWKSRLANAKTLAQSLSAAEDLYFLANGKFTIEPTELSIDLPAGYSCDEGTAPKRCSFGNMECKFSTIWAGIVCDVYKDGEPYIGYVQWYDNSPYPGLRSCRTYSPNDLGNVANQVCKGEAKRSSPSSSYSTYNQYQY